MAISRPSDLVGGGGLRAGSGARPIAGAKGKYVSKGTGKTGSNAVKKAKTATKKAAQNSTKVKSNALQKSKTRAKSKGRYDEYETKFDHIYKEDYVDKTGNRTNKKVGFNKDYYYGLHSFPKVRKAVAKKTPNKQKISNSKLKRKIERARKNDPWFDFVVSAGSWGGE